jgi:hypothetical protein
MAYVESAAVLYLRTIYGGVDPVGPRSSPVNPLPNFAAVEIGREVATLVMLAAVGYLAGTSFTSRLGAFAIAFGVWDIFYYVFLRLFAGWPANPFTPDKLFLLPLPWWGPVLSPVLLALLIVGAGAAAMARELGDGVPRPARSHAVAVLAGVGLCLVAFMADALRALPDGLAAAFFVRGGDFPWPLYAVGLLVAAWGLVRSLTRVERTLAV